MPKPEADKSLWHQLLEERLTRRRMLKGGIAALGASVLPLDLQVSNQGPIGPKAGNERGGISSRLAPPFRPIRPTTVDDLVVPAGYRYDILRIYGDDIADGQPFGYNADFNAFF